MKMDLSFLTKPIFYLMIPLALLMIGISAFAPTVGAFDESLVVSGLNQADSKMQVTRTQVDNATATDYNVSNGVTMIGDSVNLRAQDYLTKAIPGIQIDAVVSRQLENGMKVFETDISNKVLLKKCGHCPRNQYCKQLQRVAGISMLRKLPKRPSLDPCDTI